MNANELKSTRLAAHATKSNVEMSGAHDYELANPQTLKSLAGYNQTWLIPLEESGH